MEATKIMRFQLGLRMLELTVERDMVSFSAKVGFCDRVVACKLQNFSPKLHPEQLGREFHCTQPKTGFQSAS